MEDYQKRIIVEKQELDIRLEKLILFLSSDTFKTLCISERKNLTIQLEVMKKYSDILEARIKNI